MLVCKEGAVWDHAVGCSTALFWLLPHKAVRGRGGGGWGGEFGLVCEGIRGGWTVV